MKIKKSFKKTVAPSTVAGWSGGLGGRRQIWLAFWGVSDI